MKSKKEILKNLKNTYCRLRPSKIEGVGIFAIREISKGVNPFYGSPKRKWQKLKPQDYKNLDKEIKKMIGDFFAMDKDGAFSIPEYGLNGIDISFFLNTSENPNIKTIDDGTNFIATRKIKKGEELTVSYADYDERYN
jgi:SET domain-containing protein